MSTPGNETTAAMNDLLARSWGLLVFRGVIALVFGIMALVWPGVTLVALVILWGAYAFVDGISTLAMAFTGRGGERWIMVVMGIVGIVAGLIAFAWPGITAVMLLIMIAAWAIVTGAMHLLTAWRLRGEMTGNWLLVLDGLAGIALGIVLFVNPGTGALAMVLVIGALAVAWGVFTLVLGLRMRGATRHHRPGTAGMGAAHHA
ncbi:MAG TPA: HdeD family acid-resistance protein [Stackebrandtia sp.]|jgi:uncharacterized membrane protein HdeD (DUF308 family)|uniref:HdeD family acid-resistance protein n=1 Tax=Stackebrandtia sp. TaxID=2023065 RepID=UPI002D314E90|nr:HdeD family acid-resistance protein [Stackebrandtia sp.]HZE41743.1 HdeD family acid-resistance protein [Stackebrandtia sp.]